MDSDYSMYNPGKGLHLNCYSNSFLAIHNNCQLSLSTANSLW